MKDFSHSGKRMIGGKHLLLNLFILDEEEDVKKPILLIEENLNKFASYHIDDELKLYELLSADKKPVFETIFSRQSMFQIISKTEDNETIILNLLRL